MQRRTRPRARTVLATIAVIVLALAGVTALGLYLAPRVLPNLATSVAERDVSHTVSADGMSARITVPAGWAVRRGDEPDRLRLRSPDGELAVDLALRPESVDSGFAAQAAGLPAEAWGSDARERLASGFEVVHAQTADGMLVGAIGMPDGPASLAVVARGPADRFDAYRPVLAHLIESVRILP